MKKLIISAIAAMSISAFATKEADGQLNFISPGLTTEATYMEITTTDGTPSLTWGIRLGSEPLPEDKVIIHLNTDNDKCYGVGKMNVHQYAFMVYELRLTKACIGAKVKSAQVEVKSEKEGVTTWDFKPVRGNVI